MVDDTPRKAAVIVNGFDPDSESFKPRRHEVDATGFTTVLDALINIKETMDNALSVRYSCRMGICGSCAMVINGKPMLACETKVLDELGKKGEVAVEPMRGHPILRGLVTDFDDFFAKHRSLEPWLIRSDMGEKFSTDNAFALTDAERDAFIPFAECIKCGLCVDACPVANTNKKFKGPQALAQAYRYFADARDQGGAHRLEIADTLEGAWGCEFAGSCSKVCPKGVDPAFAIQLLKSSIAMHGMGLDRKKKPTAER
jgi:succinate dehydrogenase / fumarate reductase iron-sulfur subunit